MISKSKFSLFYLIVWLIMTSCLLIGLKFHYKNNYSLEKLESLISSKSRWSDSNNDICKFEIKGDPVNTGDDFVKIFFYCKDGSVARSTLALKAIKGNTYQDVVDEYARIIGFDPNLINGVDSRWKCSVNSDPLKSFDQKISLKVLIECRE